MCNDGCLCGHTHTPGATLTHTSRSVRSPAQIRKILIVLPIQYFYFLVICLLSSLSYWYIFLVYTGWYGSSSIIPGIYWYVRSICVWPQMSELMMVLWW